mgnify:CR=1 FL=1
MKIGTKILAASDIESKYLKGKRRIWYSEINRSKTEPDVILLFLDGEHYLDRMDILTLLNESGIQNLLSVFVSSENGECRQTDFICCESYNQFLSENVLKRIESDYGSLTVPKIGICGLSLSGLAAAYMAIASEIAFAFAICQSPSAWWNNEWLTRNLNRFKPKDTAYWISVGNREVETNVYHPPLNLHQEISQLDACRNLSTRLLVPNRSCYLNEFDGGHSFDCWRIDFQSAIDYCLNLNLPE